MAVLPPGAASPSRGAAGRGWGLARSQRRWQGDSVGWIQLAWNSGWDQRWNLAMGTHQKILQTVSLTIQHDLRHWPRSAAWMWAPVLVTETTISQSQLPFLGLRDLLHGLLWYF